MKRFIRVALSNEAELYKLVKLMLLLLKKNAFSLSLLAIVWFAIVFPQVASGSELLNSKWLSKSSVAIIFFLQGWSLPTRSLAAGYKPLRLHGFVLFWNFVCFPAVAMLMLCPVAWFLPSELLLGFGVLAFLPTTIASATAYTAISEGNVANAIVSTVLSNLLAVFVVPAVAVVYFRLELSIDIPFSKVLLSLMYTLVAPLTLGQIFQRLFRGNANTMAKMARWTSAFLILFIVYLAFAGSMNAGIFERLSFGSLIVTLLTVVLLLLVTSVLVWKSVFWLDLKMSQRIAAFYCGSQKSLASGLPLVSSILLSIPSLKDTAIIFIPLLCFHPLQMLLAGIVSPLLKSERNTMEA